MRRRCEFFTSSDYWFNVWRHVLVKNGDLSILSDAWVIGLGAGFSIITEVLRESGGFEDVTGSARILKAYNASWGSGKVTAIVSAGGGGYVEALVAMASERGVKALLGVGLCGALSSELGVGDVILPTAALRDDGITRKYVPEGFPAIPNHELLKELENELRAQGINPAPEPVVTTSSTFTESIEWAKKLSKLGIKCVECETSVLYTLTQLCRIPSAVVLVVSDSVIKGEEAFTEKPAKNKLRNTMKKTLKATLNIASKHSTKQ